LNVFPGSGSPGSHAQQTSSGKEHWPLTKYTNHSYSLTAFSRKNTQESIQHQFYEWAITTNDTTNLLSCQSSVQSNVTNDCQEITYSGTRFVKPYEPVTYVKTFY